VICVHKSTCKLVLAFFSEIVTELLECFFLSFFPSDIGPLFFWDGELWLGAGSLMLVYLSLQLLWMRPQGTDHFVASGFSTLCF